MRLRNIKRAEQVISKSNYLLNDKEKVKEFIASSDNIYIEIGMGKGKFIIENALKYSENKYIGIEKYGSVALRAVEALEYMNLTAFNKIQNKNIENPINPIQKEQYDNLIKQYPIRTIDNLKFIRTDAGKLLDLFEDNCIDGIYLNFSDPWMKQRQSNRRLTSDRFLEIFKVILKKPGFIEQKTDNKILFDYSVKKFKEYGFKVDYISYDLYSEPILLQNNIPTEYETKFHNLGNTIYKIRVVYY